ncbi:hypothetical protein ABBQ38_012352 [Trebouxia sp. C0009 RCD-2024]
MLPVLGFAPILDAGSPEQVKVNDNRKAGNEMKKQRASINVNVRAHSESPLETQT